MRSRSVSLASVLAVVLAACGGSAGVRGGDSSGGGDGAGGAGAGGGGAAADDGGTTAPGDDGGGGANAAPDGGAGSSGDGAAPGDPTDGPPAARACTAPHGSALTSVYGRLDGFVSATACGPVNDHVHVQVKMNGATYDVAVNLDTLVAETDAPLPLGPWSEGWHTGASELLDYAQSLGVHAQAFQQPASMPALAQKIEQELATANHVSIFGTAYGPSGTHDIHRKGSGHDGAIVIDPLSPKAHLLLFRFTNDSF